MLKKNKIKNLGPGREMDLLIAEHVFGWEEWRLRLVLVPSSLEEALEWGWEEYTDETYDWHRGFNIGSPSKPINLHRPKGWDYHALPRWSTNIFLAWDVFETLPLPRSVHERYPESVVKGSTFMCQAGNVMKWRDTVDCYGDPRSESYTVTYRGFGDTVQVAICRAALIYQMKKYNE